MDTYVTQAMGSAVVQYEGAHLDWAEARANGGGYPAGYSLEEYYDRACTRVEDIRSDIATYRAHGLAVPGYLADDLRAAIRARDAAYRALDA